MLLLFLIPDICWYQNDFQSISGSFLVITVKKGYDDLRLSIGLLQKVLFSKMSLILFDQIFVIRKIRQKIQKVIVIHIKFHFYVN